MKALFASLLCLVFTAVQTFAIGGGPNYGNNEITTTGIYSGVMLANNSLGLFSVTLPKTGLGSGPAVIFGVTKTYSGALAATADPDSGQFWGDIATTEATASNSGSTSTIAATADGKIFHGQLTANSNTFSTATVRLTASANIHFSEENPADIDYQVIGFKQAEAP